MANARYNFAIKVKPKVGRLQGLPFTTAWFVDDTAAMAFATWLETHLANYAKVSVSKVIHEPAAESWEIPKTHTLTDTEDVGVVMYNEAAGQKKRFYVTIPGIKKGEDISDINTLEMQYYDEAVELDAVS